jgi:predicted PurR-regulated permease PerM
VITPRILGGRVGLPPLAVLLAVMGAGELFGFAGMLLAVPAAAVIKVLLAHARRSYMDSEGYRGRAAMSSALPASGGSGPEKDEPPH